MMSRLTCPYRFLSFGLTVPSSAVGFALVVEGTLLFSNVTSNWTASVCLDILGGNSIALAGHGVIDGNGAAWWPYRAVLNRPGLVTTSSSVHKSVPECAQRAR